MLLKSARATPLRRGIFALLWNALDTAGGKFARFTRGYGGICFGRKRDENYHQHSPNALRRASSAEIGGLSCAYRQTTTTPTSILASILPDENECITTADYEQTRHTHLGHNTRFYFFSNARVQGGAPSCLSARLVFFVRFLIRAFIGITQAIGRVSFCFFKPLGLANLRMRSGEERLLRVVH